MQSIKNKISNHNRRLLEKKKKSTADKNCRNKECCPLDNQCLTTNIIYKAEVEDNVGGDTKGYIGNTAETFKKRYANHVKSLNIQRYSTETELSKYAWKLKKKTRDLIPSSGQSLSEFLHTPLGEIVAIFALRRNVPY